ncbi:MAG: beta-galactosidase [Lachnospiraceae bacterium]|nr:beta-galactosidase [Lachnospiraceae bacterium]
MVNKYVFGRPIGKIVHGGDYNPEQWLDRPDILQKDVEYMKEAGINEATLGVFSWATYEPREGEFHFEWLREIMDRLYANGIYTILATPSGARPVWMDQKYPEVMRVDGMGNRNRHGQRHNHCLSSGIFREKMRIINGKLAQAFSDHPGLLAWHISNEFGGECYCRLCTERFREYLRRRFHGNIEELNHEWWTTFWSARYSDFSEIEPPFQNGQTAIMGLNLEWRRFTTWNYEEYLMAEINALRAASDSKNIPVTTNFMGRFYGIDYHSLAKRIDFISWDSYPAFHNDQESYEETMLTSAFDHAIMRGMKKEQPFLLMESAPGLVNWMPYNKLKRPLVHEQFAVQALACGSDSVQYFQWRKSRGAAEQFHGAVISHDGTSDTRTFREVAHTGEILKRLSKLEGTVKRNKAAILFDWNNWWAIDGSGGLSGKTKKYDVTCMDYWKALMRQGVEADVISQEEDFSEYELVIAPMLFLLKPGTAERLKSFVEKGGILLGTYLMGYVNENCLCFMGGFPGDGLRELFGIMAEDIDTLYPSDSNGILPCGNGYGTGSFTVKDYAELLKNDDAEVLGTYAEDFYAGRPALTCKSCGGGKAYYQAARCSMSDMDGFFARLLSEAGIETKKLPSGVEYHERIGESGVYEFYLNVSEGDAELTDLAGIDLITGCEISGAARLGPKKYLILERRGFGA